jgi:hypothetical protein
MSDLRWTNFDNAYGGVIEHTDGKPDTEEFYRYYDADECREMTKHLSKGAQEILDVLLLGGYAGTFPDLIEASQLLERGWQRDA